MAGRNAMSVQLELAPFEINQSVVRRKVCGSCRVEKPVASFSKESKAADGRQSRCKVCVSIYDKSRPPRKETLEQILRKAERAKSPRSRAQRAAYAKSKTGRLSKFVSKLRSDYRIELADWLAMWEAQSGKCARCCVQMTKPPQLDGRRGRAGPVDACVDHCHTTGMVRALLCGPCNRRIGHLERPDARHVGDLDYLKRFRAP